MRTSFATSPDGLRVAYDATGVGPALVLLHGGGQTRRVWHEQGYVARLCDQFRVITVDLRGNGESDKPSEASAYTIERIAADVFAVADAAGARQFALWGFSYGANVGRYLPMRSDRVTTLVVIGVGFGTATPGPFRDYCVNLRSKWQPVIEAWRAGALDVAALPQADRVLWEARNIPSTIAQLSAMLDWPSVEPADVRCSTLWLVGTANESAMASVEEYGNRLVGTRVTLETVPGLTHAQELTDVDHVLGRMVRFTLGATV